MISGPTGPRRERPPAASHRSAGPRPAAKVGSSPGTLAELVERYGWRIYALPVLALVTVVALLQPGRAHTSAQAAPPAGPAAKVGAVATTAAATPTTAPPTQVWSESEPTACAHNTKTTYVLVDISAQHAWMCDGARQVNSSAVTTGATALNDATPTGSWIVQAKQPNRWLSGKDYNRFVHYWVPFDGDIGFHDAGWQTMAFGASGYPKLGSHGCVHMPTSVMAWLYKWIQPGSTTVTIVA